ncbi:MAG: hypothetical protein QF886_19680, partial [Planctomycetota bacterium]|nr:hypothetical protein [Planctomycetota bacterium]
LIITPSASAQRFAGMLADDTWTRGNWVGQYGGYAYALFGAESPKSTFGGPGWPVHLRGYTGDPEDSHRAWLSRMNTVADDRALQTPDGKSRIASVWDDHSEIRKPGEKAPGLLIDLNLPEGLCLLSLYFFEIDWPQHRDYKLHLLSREPKKLILTTTAGHFSGGKYKRFALNGHRKITIHIETLASPNAVISGLFIDRLGDLIKLPEWVEEETYKPGNFRNQLAGKVVAAQKALKKVEEEGTGEEEYLKVEASILAFAHWAEGKVPSAIFGLLHRESTSARQRLNRFVRLSFSSLHHEHALQLAWCWASAIADIPAQKIYLKQIEAIKTHPADGVQIKIGSPIRNLANASTAALRGRAREFLNSGNFGSFAVTMRNLAQQHPEDMQPEDHYLLANALVYQGNCSDAVNHFSRPARPAFQTGHPPGPI